MRIDVLVPTFNRAELLTRTLVSLRDASVPAGLEAGVLVVDNNSRDATREVVESLAPSFGGRLRYTLEPKVGKSHALNTGIAATTGDLVGMIDDDEEVDARWLEIVADAFRDPTVDFIGGPYKPRWGAPAPAWLPPRPSSIVGWVEPSIRRERFGDPAFNAMLMGGNAVVRRTVLARVGGYSTALGPTAKQRLGSGEDEDMYLRLLAAGARGEYRPDLIIHHYIPPARLSKSYHRRWTFWHAVTATSVRAPGERAWLGTPLWEWRLAVRSGVSSVGRRIGLGPNAEPWERFDRELRWWQIFGTAYGRARRLARF